MKFLTSAPNFRGSANPAYPCRCISGTSQQLKVDIKDKTSEVSNNMALQIKLSTNFEFFVGIIA